MEQLLHMKQRVSSGQLAAKGDNSIQAVIASHSFPYTLFPYWIPNPGLVLQVFIEIHPVYT